MPSEIITLTKEQLEKGKIQNNHILIEMLHSNEQGKTKSGFDAGWGYGLTFAEGDNSIGADLMEVFGRVKRVPNKIVFDPKSSISIPWDTDIEVEEGDIAWFGIIESNNALEIHCDGKRYRLIPYEDMYVARKGGMDGRVVCLNGHVLLSTVNKTKISELDVISEDQIDFTRGIVEYYGSCNKRYTNPKYADHRDLKKGDLVLFMPRTPVFFLERKAAFSYFQGDDLFMVVQRRRIAMVLERAFKKQ